MTRPPLKPGVRVHLTEDMEESARRYVVALVLGAMRKSKVCSGDCAKFIGAAGQGGFQQAIEEAKRWVNVTIEPTEGEK